MEEEECQVKGGEKLAIINFKKSEKVGRRHT
jgi:hypothetical protein